jgi:hypothetical protein
MSFILDALKKVDRKTNGQADDGVLMQGGRRWGETRSGNRWALGAVVVLAIAALSLATVALFQSFDAKTTKPSAIASEPPSSEPASTPAEAPKKAPPTSSPGAAAERSREAEPPSEEELLAEDEATAEMAPPVKLVGRNAVDPPSSSSMAAEGEGQGEEAEHPGGLPRLVLQGTSVIDGKPVAVVNYQRVFEGDFIEGARVIKILDRAVELEFEGNRFTIRL